MAANRISARDLMPPNASSRVRLFIYSYLLLIVYFGIDGRELWPLTGWRLFSALRTDVQTSWQVEYVTVEGQSALVPFGRMSWAYRGAPQILATFDTLSKKEQAGICTAWLEAVDDLGIAAEKLHIYRTRWRLSERQGRRAAPPDRALEFVCSRSQVSKR